MRTIQREIVSAVLLSKDQKLFLGKKNANNRGVYPDCWHIPGGGVEPGESKESALIREIMEEANMDISQYFIELLDNTRYGKSQKTLKDTGETVNVDMHFNDYKITLLTTAAETKVELTEEFDEYMWADLSELKNLKLTPPSIELFTQLGWLV